MRVQGAGLRVQGAGCRGGPPRERCSGHRDDSSRPVPLERAAGSAFGWGVEGSYLRLIDFCIT